MKQAFQILEELTRICAPKIRIPYFVAWAAAHVDETISKISGKPPRAPLAGVRMARYKMFFNPAKAVKELGLPQTNPREALADAVAWFQKHGSVRS
jgi:dihydroflavonol-4-reductase